MFFLLFRIIFVHDLLINKTPNTYGNQINRTSDGLKNFPSEIALAGSSDASQASSDHALRANVGDRSARLNQADAGRGTVGAPSPRVSNYVQKPHIKSSGQFGRKGRFNIDLSKLFNKKPNNLTGVRLKGFFNTESSNLESVRSDNKDGIGGVKSASPSRAGDVAAPHLARAMEVLSSLKFEDKTLALSNGETYSLLGNGNMFLGGVGKDLDVPNEQLLVEKNTIISVLREAKQALRTAQKEARSELRACRHIAIPTQYNGLESKLDNALRAFDGKRMTIAKLAEMRREPALEVKLLLGRAHSLHQEIKSISDSRASLFDDTRVQPEPTSPPQTESIPLGKIHGKVGARIDKIQGAFRLPRTIIETSKGHKMELLNTLTMDDQKAFETELTLMEKGGAKPEVIRQLKTVRNGPLKKVLGKGSFGKVRLAVFDGNLVAVKKVTKAEQFDSMIKSSKMVPNSPYIAKHIDHAIVSGKKGETKAYFFQELVVGKELTEVLYSDVGKNLSDEIRLNWAMDAANAFNDLDKEGKYIMDGKCDNFVVDYRQDSNGQLKMIDMDTIVDTYKPDIYTFTNKYFPPEGMRRAYLVDAFSLGVTLWKIAYNEFPTKSFDLHDKAYAKQKNGELFNSVLRESADFIDECDRAGYLPDQTLRSIALQALHPSPRKRMLVPEIHAALKALHAQKTNALGESSGAAHKRMARVNPEVQQPNTSLKSAFKPISKDWAAQAADRSPNTQRVGFLDRVQVKTITSYRQDSVVKKQLWLTVADRAKIQKGVEKTVNMMRSGFEVEGSRGLEGKVDYVRYTHRKSVVKLLPRCQQAFLEMGAAHPDNVAQTGAEFYGHHSQKSRTDAINMAKDDRVAADDVYREDGLI